nr:hypothetical protein [Brevibacterium daeguense]
MHARRTRSARRRITAASSAVVLLAGIAACSPGGQDHRVEFVDEAPASEVIEGDDPTATALATSSALFESADVAVVAAADSAEALGSLSAEARLPLLVGTDSAVTEELDRLGADILVTAAGTDLGELAEGREVIEVDPASDDAADSLPEVAVDEEPAGASAFVDPDDPAAAQAVAMANVEAAGGTVVEVSGGDPRFNGDTVAATRDALGEDGSGTGGLLAVGAGFGSAEEFAGNVQTALTVPELPGGGQVAFPGRRMVAAYGSPGVPSLGILGEQDLESTIERVTELAEDYEPHSEVPVVPAFEIITTVASASPGPDGNYSTELDAELIREWVDAAGEAGVYVVLDLQPGHTDFLTQAKLYEDLLREPHVGLALDPEWRLKPGQRHMAQIGSVPAAEINETADWLAQLTAENGLPQKVFILHQFSHGMITDRQDVDTSHPELAMLLHADGHGTPDLKMGTWNALQEGLPEGIRMAWKNFYDEDTPTFTPEQTYEVEPRPWFVSYQ